MEDLLDFRTTRGACRGLYASRNVRSKVAYGAIRDLTRRPPTCLLNPPPYLDENRAA